MSRTIRSLAALVVVAVTYAAARRYFVAMLTRTTGTWMGGVGGDR